MHRTRRPCQDDGEAATGVKTTQTTNDKRVKTTDMEMMALGVAEEGEETACNIIIMEDTTVMGTDTGMEIIRGLHTTINSSSNNNDNSNTIRRINISSRINESGAIIATSGDAVNLFPCHLNAHRRRTKVFHEVPIPTTPINE